MCGSCILFINPKINDYASLRHCMLLYVVPKLKYLRANGLANGSISLEWRLEYDGGHPIINFEIHVTSGAGRTKRDTTGPDLVYHTNVANNQLVTSPVRLGQTYSVMATAFNVLGASDPQATNGWYLWA